MLHELSLSQLSQCLDWRYSTKVFDSSKKLSEEQVAVLVESLVKSASSFGLQPWKFLVVTNPEVRAKLREVSWNQAQVEEASHLLVLAKKDGIEEADIERNIECIAAAQGKAKEDLAPLKGMMMGFAMSKSPDEQAQWNKNQVYIALGQLLACAAVIGVDACPMEGLDAAAYDRILGLEGSGYSTVVACPIGYRSADDKYSGYRKARYAASEVVVRVD